MNDTVRSQLLFFIRPKKKKSGPTFIAFRHRVGTQISTN